MAGTHNSTLITELCEECAGYGFNYSAEHDRYLVCEECGGAEVSR